MGLLNHIHAPRCLQEPFLYPSPCFPFPPGLGCILFFPSLFASLSQVCSNCGKLQHKVPSTHVKPGRLTQEAELCNTKPLHKEFSSIETAVNAKEESQQTSQDASKCTPGIPCSLPPDTISPPKGKSSAESLPRGPEFQTSQRRQQGPLIAPVEAPGKRQLTSLQAPRSLDGEDAFVPTLPAPTVACQCCWGLSGFSCGQELKHNER